MDKGQNIIIGYLSGTCDLFHIGHLNIIKRAKARCDYLIVGVHETTSFKGGRRTFIPYPERLEIVRACLEQDWEGASEKLKEHIMVSKQTTFTLAFEKLGALGIC